MENRCDLKIVTSVYEDIKYGDDHPVIDTIDNECIKNFG